MREGRATGSAASALAGAGMSPDMLEVGDMAFHVGRWVNDEEIKITGPATDDRGKPEFEGMV